MKPSFLIAVLFAACAAQTQTLRVVPVHLEGTGQTTKSVQFFCTQDYNRDECLQHALELRRVLMTYPLERLGMWSFALVPSDKWKDLVRALGGSTHSPAFTIFEQRTTVMESSLFSATATRSAEFRHVFGVTGEALLELAVNHELGHAFARRETNSGRRLWSRTAPDEDGGLHQNAGRSIKDTISLSLISSCRSTASARDNHAVARFAIRLVHLKIVVVIAL